MYIDISVTAETITSPGETSAIDVHNLGQKALVVAAAEVADTEAEVVAAEATGADSEGAEVAIEVVALEEAEVDPTEEGEMTAGIGRIKHVLVDNRMHAICLLNVGIII